MKNTVKPILLMLTFVPSEEPLGYDYEPHFAWNGDGTKADVTLVCKNDPTDRTELSADVQRKMTYALCESDGVAECTASVYFYVTGKTYTDVKNVKLPAPRTYSLLPYRPNHLHGAGLHRTLLHEKRLLLFR